MSCIYREYKGENGIKYKWNNFFFSAILLFGFGVFGLGLFVCLFTFVLFLSPQNLSFIIYFLHTYGKVGGLYKEIESHMHSKDPPETVWPELKEKEIRQVIRSLFCFKYKINIVSDKSLGTVVKLMYQKLWIYILFYITNKVLFNTVICPFHTSSKSGLFLYPHFHLFTLFIYTKVGMAKILFYNPKYPQIKISYKSFFFSWQSVIFFFFFWLCYVIAPCNFKGC